MTVSSEDKNAMAKLMRVMEGLPPLTSTNPASSNKNTYSYVELGGPGEVTQQDKDAMASILRKFNSAAPPVNESIVTESYMSPNYEEALQTERVTNGVKIGRYQITIKEDAKRLAGKQYYSIFNSITGDVIADDISLYETALSVVRMLNNGKFTNSPEIRKLFEYDDTYTSHRVDALMYKRKMSSTNDISKRDIFESRYQASLDRCMSAKKLIKDIVK